MKKVLLVTIIYILSMLPVLADSDGIKKSGFLSKNITTKVNEALEDQVIAGDADTVLQKLVAFREEVGPFGTLLMTGHDWDEKELWQGSMRMLAQDVMPRLSQHANATDPNY